MRRQKLEKLVIAGKFKRKKDGEEAKIKISHGTKWYGEKYLKLIGNIQDRTGGEE